MPNPPLASPKVRGRPFVKGQSGNPGGRTKEMAWLRDEARKLAAKSLAALADVLDTGTGSERVSAARELLDRGFGKATQIIAGDPDGEPVNLALTVRFVRPEPASTPD